ncbi:hypothetical protein Lalb_Chr14g0370031 [Lupinus albus]|uniref:Uncharacterized protein n=1 Tax=Lupinus albus TaxID=3870 RepID=A0A6A4PF91_LUPAL|nr:hypothetical protein Lalb_Chr14g0370031 [Lupinus albus]
MKSWCFFWKVVQFVKGFLCDIYIERYIQNQHQKEKKKIFFNTHLAINLKLHQCFGVKDFVEKMASSTLSSCCSRIYPSNLQRFLQCVTPLVPSHTLPQSSFNDLNSLWYPLGKDPITFFSLKDLWDCCYEWSAYGAGVPVMLDNGVIVVQYYVPYLSAIQIYANKSVAASRNRKEDSDGVIEFECDL